MAGIGKIVTSFFAGSAETTLALANLNFDFSLVKVNAPIEFEGVGNALSTRRRDAAESGPSHVTARKLGALFESIIPPTPKLYEAYGSRASEICKAHHKKEYTRQVSGVFSDFSGPDATSIWAAATSGNAAIAVHLLACLLARFWKAEEAISIWEEIVDARKAQLEENARGETFQMATLLASQVALTHEQLAQWDNSARAWLRYADRARETQQTKLKLAIDELSQEISTRSSLYESVIDAWAVGLKGMEQLLKGASQGVSHAGVILALSSWHLYPDLSVRGNAPIMQHDCLFPRGTVTSLYLEGSPNKTKSGISWSLSLSHLRYYGAPVVTERGYASDTSRITFTQFLITILGSLSGKWRSRSTSPLDVARIVQLLNQRLGALAPAWMRMLQVAAEELLTSNDAQRQLNLKLFRLGRERGSAILAPRESHPVPVFGLADCKLFMGSLKSPGTKLKMLRKYASRFFPDARPGEIVLKIQVPNKSQNVVMTAKRKFDDIAEDTYEFTSAIKKVLVLDDAEVQDRSSHQEQAESDVPSISVPQIVTTLEVEGEDETKDPAFLPTATYRTDFVTALPIEPDGPNPRKTYIHWSHWEPDSALCELMDNEEHIHCQTGRWMNVTTEHTSEISINEGVFTAVCHGTKDALKNQSEKLQEFRDYKFFLGDLESCAIFAMPELIDIHRQATTGPRWGRTSSLIEEIDLTDVIAALESDELNVAMWVESLTSHAEIRELAYYKSLTALAAVWALYSRLGEASIDPAVLSKPIMESPWATKILTDSVANTTSRQLDRGQAFSCISDFETGGIGLKPSDFNDVMAISNGESIYVSAPLLSDPASNPDSNKIIRLDGNVGISGLVLMVPPADPMVLKPNDDNWRLIDREEYTGQKEDHFAKTSLHLSFTDWSAPVNTGDTGRGRRSAEASLVETLVSVFDHGRWIADLDVLTALRRGCSQPDHEFFFSRTCGHSEKKGGAGTLDSYLEDGITTIRSWDEFLDRPKAPAVVLACGNWEAKLAAAAIGVARGDRVFIGHDDEICEPCLEGLVSFGGTDLSDRALFIV